MNKRLYLDGCSFTYGLGLEHHDTLAGRWESEYDVINNARPGKSNLAIALDTFKNIQTCDIMVIGWTFSSRSYLKYYDYDIDLLPSSTADHLSFGQNIDRNTKVIHDTYADLHRNFYALHDVKFANHYSDFLVCSIKAMCEQYQKTSVFFSWERRNTNFDMCYPNMSKQMRLPDGHLNVDGITHLYNNLQQLIYEQGR